MQDKESKNELGEFGDEIDLKELFFVLIRGKWIISSTTIFLMMIGIFYSLSLPDIYESKALLAPVDQSDTAAGSLKQFSGLAGLAGINLSSGDSGSNSKKAIEMIDSLNFFENQIMPKIFIQILLLSNLGIMKQIQFFMTIVFLISVRTLGLKNLKIQNNRYQARNNVTTFLKIHI